MSNANHESSSARLPEYLDLLTIAIALARHWKLLSVGPVVIAVLAVAMSFLLPNVYLGVARILPPQSQSIAAQLIAQYGLPGGMAGGVSGGVTPLAYVGMLQGTHIADRIIDRFVLVERYTKWHGGKRSRLELRAKLDDLTSISLSPEGLIVIEVEDRDPEMAARLANAYVEELRVLRRTMDNARAADKVAFL